MLRIPIDVELMQKLQLVVSGSWACVGIAELTLKRSEPRGGQYRLSDSGT